MRWQQDKFLEGVIQLGPMIDCMMILLLYFIIAGRIDIQEKYLGLMIPNKVILPPTNATPVEIVVNISAAGLVSCNSQPLGNADDVELAAMRAKLEQAIKLFGDKQPVVIQPEPRVNQQRIADVLSACSAAGVKNLSFDISQPAMLVP